MLQIILVQGFSLLKIKITQFRSGFRLKKGNNSKLLNMLVIIVTLRNTQQPLRVNEMAHYLDGL